MFRQEKNEDRTLKECFEHMLKEDWKALDEEEYLVLTPKRLAVRASITQTADLISELVYSLLIRVETDKQKDEIISLFKGAIDFARIRSGVDELKAGDIMHDLLQILRGKNNEH